MKKILIGGMLLCVFQAYCQTTHVVAVAINQEEECQIVDGLEESDLFKVFPNPVKSSFTIQSELRGAFIKLVDTQGRVQRSGKLKEGKLEIQVSDLARGIYILYLESPSGYDQIKIKIQ
ncbi:MAG: T9SS type A sorting domain-containing protein [Cyclobacteriaceae bacterium]